MGYQVKLDSFTGPLDLLLHLIEKDELDMYQIPLADITEEYISYIRTLEKLELENISEFIAIAVHLLEIKAALLLPDPIKPKSSEELPEKDLKEQLVERLLEYKKYKNAAGILAQWEELSKRVYSRQADKTEENELLILSDIAVGELTRRLSLILERRKMNKKETKIIVLEQYTVEERMEQIAALLESAAAPLEFEHIFKSDNDKLALLTSFLALLELVKLNKLSIKQEENFGPIWIMREGYEWKNINC